MPLTFWCQFILIDKSFDVVLHVNLLAHSAIALCCISYAGIFYCQTVFVFCGQCYFTVFVCESAVVPNKNVPCTFNCSCLVYVDCVCMLTLSEFWF